MRARRALMVASLSMLCVSSHAYAQPTTTVTLELPSCLDASWRDQLVNGAGIELREDGASLLTVSSPSGEIHIAVTIACGSEPREARLQLDHPAKTTTLSRTVQLSDVPQQLRPRTLALAIAELWRASKSLTPAARPAGLAATPATSPPTAAERSTPVRASAEAASDDTREPDRASYADAQSGTPTLSLAPALRLYFAARNTLPGAQLAFSWGSWRIGAEGFYSSHADVLGSARFGLVQGFVSWELARVHFGAYGLTLGPRAAIGGILATATAQAPAFASATSIIAWDVASEAAFWRTLSSRWRIALRVQLGYAHGTVLASDVSELARLHGLFGAASLALELRLTDS